MTSRLDGDIAIGDRVRVDRGEYQGREGTVVKFEHIGFAALVNFEPVRAWITTGKLTVTDPAGLCRIHQISRCTICAPTLVERDQREGRNT